MDDLVERLKDIRRRVSAMCQSGRGFLMHVPADPDDDDLFICATADEAADRIAVLEAERDRLKARAEKLEIVAETARGAERILQSLRPNGACAEALGRALAALEEPCHG